MKSWGCGMKKKFSGEVSYTTPAVETPYLKAKSVWDHRLGAMAADANYWRWIALTNFFIIILLLAALIISLASHKPKLYIAEITENGLVKNVQLLQHAYQPTEAQEEYFVAQFIKLVQGLSLDPVATKHNWLTAYHFLDERGSKLLNKHFQEHNPLALLNKQTTTLEVTNINPIGRNTYHVTWLEDHVNNQGALLQKVSMEGSFTLIKKQPQTKEEILENPLGIYITDFYIYELTTKRK